MAFPFKTGGDFYNCEAQRMRLHNLGANPTETATGLMYFNTGTSNLGKHAVVHDGTDFKALAFVDEITTNTAFTELANRVLTIEKALGEDTANVIDTWEEIQNFLKNINNNDADLMTMLNDKLSLSQGGVMTGTIKVGNYDAFGQTGGNFYLGTPAYPLLLRSNGTTTINGNTIIHSGNYATEIGNYYLKTTDGLRRVTLANNVENDFDAFENLTLSGRGDPASGSSLLNSPWTVQPAGGFGVLTYLWSNYGIQLAASYNSNDLYIRNKYYLSGVGVTWSSSWDKILTSSNYNSYAPKLDGTGATGTWGINISGNAATATKLADNTAFTAWGQTFFENGKPKNVSGALTGVTNINGVLYINSAGNALIGTQNELKSNAKLQVKGDLYVEGNIIATKEVSAGGAGQEGESGAGGGAEVISQTLSKGASSYNITNTIKRSDIAVSLYEWNASGNSWDMCLADISVTNSNITVTFGSTTTVDHKLVAVG